MIAKARICSFTSDVPVSRKTDYRTFRERVLRAGRFSVFQATASQYAARLYTRLEQDPTVEVTRAGFPWCTVKRRGETE